MKSTRDVVLQTLLDHSRCTISELAQEVGINPISVRHHIAKLEADSMVSSDEERHGVGRPRRIYFLTEKGLESFPSRYIQISNRLIQQIKTSFSEKAVNTFFSSIGKTIVNEKIDVHQLEKLKLEERLDLLKEIMVQEGVNIGWEYIGNQYQLKVNQCPFFQVGQTHKEICIIDLSIVSEMLLIPAELIQTILEGEEQCLYIVPNRHS